MKKITVKTEKEVLRKAIPYGDEVIVINELSERQKIELINELQKDLATDNKINERKFMLNIIDKCTNVVFDKDIFEVADPTYEVAMIIGEVTLMFLEIVEEQRLYANIQLKINGNKKEEPKKEEVKEEVKEEPKKEEVKEEVKEEIKETKIIKPKKRPRGKR